MFHRGSQVRQSLTNFTKDVENNGLRAAINSRRKKIHDDQSSVDDASSTTGGSPRSVMIAPCDSDDQYTLGDHMEYLGVGKDLGGNYFVDSSGNFTEAPLAENLVQDFCSPVPTKSLQALYYKVEDAPEIPKEGFVEDTMNEAAPKSDVTEPLPVRTMTFRLRPDTMSNVIIDAVVSACNAQPDVSTQFLSRMQGHFQCLFRPEGSDIPPFVLDANVCTSRHGVFERVLLLRIYHAKNQDPQEEEKENSKAKMDQAVQRISSFSEEIMVPVNVQLRGASAFVQYLVSKKSEDGNLSSLRSPRNSPKECDAWLRATFDPTFSVALCQKFKHVKLNRVFPSLNSEDWVLLHGSWTLISSIWRGLIENTCMFHTIADVSVYDPEAGKKAGPALDFDYCSQIRELSRQQMLKETTSSFDEIQQNLNQMEASFERFVDTFGKVYKKYQLPRVRGNAKPRPYLVLPSAIPPPGFAKLAATALKFASAPDGDHVGLCDDAVLKVYKTFQSQDDHIARKHLKDGNATVMGRMVEIQKAQLDLVEDVEKRHKNTKVAAREFCNLARQATNTKGRVDQVVLARVPLLEFDIIDGNCQISSTSIVIVHQRVLQRKVYLFDLCALDFEVVSKNCLALIANDLSREVLFKLYTVVNLPNLVEFLRTLQTLQSVFSAKKSESRCSYSDDDDDI